MPWNPFDTGAVIAGVMLKVFVVDDTINDTTTPSKTTLAIWIMSVHIPILLLDTVVSYNETPFNQQLLLQDQLTAVQVQLEALSIGPAQEQDAKEDHAVETDVEHDNAVETDVEHDYAVETDVERDNAVEDQDMLVDRVNGDYEFEEEET
ncbi:hypothetical protein K457DRAFT_12381 [Linnemannia elongata AG-77]|uniref:Uncharacterized protein n=1 Tax=Linnemannia elongata AG-77 TaxID=1314771 RepID=A0A197KHW0_9FUNG|nr:hypothetical protein K457DRAFT_12381 [Linnemannia elongata AG-77]